MRVTIANQPQIEALSSPLKQSLTTMAASIQTGWNQQHEGDGGHTDVTATSVRAGDLVATGKLCLSNIVRYENLGIIPTGRLDNLTTPGLPTANVLKIRVAAVVTLTGIDATGRREGDLLLLINDALNIGSPRDFTIAANDANSIVANRFIGGVASAFPITVNDSQGVWLMYDSFSGTGLTYFTGWRVLTP